MHQAQRELAKKAERIQELERHLKSQNDRQRHPSEIAMEKMRREIASLRKKNGEFARKNAELARELAAVKKEAASRGNQTDRVDRSKKPEKGAPRHSRTITIRYGENSAANYEGREKVLEWVEKGLKNGTKKFSIEGFANDSEYPDVCEVIAHNRARYLADYLILKGIPEDSLTVVSSIAEAKGERGRYVVVSSIGR